MAVEGRPAEQTPFLPLPQLRPDLHPALEDIKAGVRRTARWSIGSLVSILLAAGTLDSGSIDGASGGTTAPITNPPQVTIPNAGVCIGRYWVGDGYYGFIQDRTTGRVTMCQADPAK